MRSNTASMTMSASLPPSSVVVGLISAMRLSISSCLSLPLETVEA